MSAPSFEFFPPKSADHAEKLKQTAQKLSQEAAPVSFSVTCGAGGSASEGTLETVLAVADVVSAPVVPHVSGYGRSREQVAASLRDIVAADLQRVLAIRGDAPVDSDCDDLPYGVSLVRLIAELQPQLEIEVACYPERHPEAPSEAADLDYLAQKEAAGAKIAVSQLFFDAGVFLRFRDRCVGAGIGLELVPGMMPVHSLSGVLRMAARCGSGVPDGLVGRLEGLEDGGEQMLALGAGIMAAEVQQLLAEGVERVHFYCLNRLQPCLSICEQVDWN